MRKSSFLTKADHARITKKYANGYKGIIARLEAEGRLPTNLQEFQRELQERSAKRSKDSRTIGTPASKDRSARGAKQSAVQRRNPVKTSKSSQDTPTSPAPNPSTDGTTEQPTFPWTQDPPGVVTKHSHGPSAHFTIAPGMSFRPEPEKPEPASASSSRYDVRKSPHFNRKLADAMTRIFMDRMKGKISEEEADRLMREAHEKYPMIPGMHLKLPPSEK